MTRYDTLNLLIALLAIGITTVSLYRTRKFNAKQLEFQAHMAALAKKQLQLIERDEKTEEQACVTAELVKVDTGDYRFVIMNQGTAVASDVTFEIDPTSPDNPLVLRECQRKLPHPSLHPGQAFTLIAALHMGSAMSYDTHVGWKNPDGSRGADDVQVST